MDDDPIANFVAITSASPERAAQYLQLADGRVQEAIQLYFDSPNLDLDASASSNAPAAPSHAATSSSQPARYTEDEGGVIHIDSDDEQEDLIDMDEESGSPRPAASSSAAPLPSTAFEDDEALARRLQEEMYGESAGTGGFGPEGVRAPMARTTETLVGPGANWGGGGEDMQAAIAEQLLARQQRRSQAARPGIFNQRDTQAAIWEDNNANEDSRRRDLARATAGASERSTKSNMLAEMYRPPFEIISRLPWDEARDEGKEKEKWILVNIQDAAIFDCQVLNRDVWKNPQIKDTIKENFIFLQYSKDDPRGSSYIQYYFQARDSQDAYPHIAIVDPRTGEQVKVWSGAPIPNAEEFLMQLHEFLDRYSLKANARNPVAKRKPERRKELDVAAMSEEEMLEMALQNSLANNAGPKEDDPDALTKSGVIGKGKERADPYDVMDTEPSASATNGATDEAPSAFAQIPSSNPHVEPPNNPATTTRIQFRHSAGRQIRRFDIDDRVRRIYEWLKASPLEGREGVEFELIFMGKNLIDLIDQTIEQAGLKNGTVMVEFVGEGEA